MATLEPGWRSWRSTSIDRAFGRLHRAPVAISALGRLALAPGRCRRHLGAPVAVGIAPSKVLAKLANSWPTPDPPWRVFDLGRRGRSPSPWLAAVAIEDVWG